VSDRHDLFSAFYGTITPEERTVMRQLEEKDWQISQLEKNIDQLERLLQLAETRLDRLAANATEAIVILNRGK
jgi:inner membrane protein involved in colicin E2 resistance